MYVNIIFHPALQKITGVKKYSVEAATFEEMKDALVVIFPKMRRYIKQILNGTLKENLCLINSKGKLLKRKDYDFNLLNDNNLTLVPLIVGSGGKGMGFLMIAAAVALIAISGGAGIPALGLTAAQATTAAIGLAIGGLMQLTMAPPKSGGGSTGADERKNNDILDQLENSTDTNAKIQFIYGMPRIAGQLLSGHIETISHTKSDTIYVSDLLYKQQEIIRLES